MGQTVNLLFRLRWFESITPHRKFTNYTNSYQLRGKQLKLIILLSGSSSFGRASAFQAEGGRFDPGLPLNIKEEEERARSLC